MNDFISYLKKTSEKADNFASKFNYPLYPEELNEGTFVYFSRGGKRLRPAILSLCAGALGGKEKEEAAIAAAVGLEFYHNYTLIHDDIIDNDSMRRGKMSVHTLIEKEISEKHGTSEENAATYGKDCAILCGDALHSAAIDMITKSVLSGVNPKTALKIISLLEGNYGLRLISGETADTKNGIIFGADGVNTVTEEEVIEMMKGKTGALFSICAVAGALIGLDSDDEKSSLVLALSDFAEKCGVAFQLKDDILGITSTEKELGKPVFSDIREGKLTVILLKSYKNSSDEEKRFLDSVLGKNPDDESLFKARDILIKNGGVEYTTSLAEKYISEAKEALLSVPESEYRNMLEKWCDFMFDRNK